MTVAEALADHGLRRLACQLKPGGVFALWSDDPLDSDFLRVLSLVPRKFSVEPSLRTIAC